MPTVLTLSPHLDDAAFSCGGTLHALGQAGWRVVVATLFTRSVPDPQGFALSCQLDKGFVPDVDYMALRRDEDRAALRELGTRIEAVHVSLPEAPHRGYDSAPALFAGLLPVDEVAAELREAVVSLVAAYAPSLVLAPQAVGGHVDHVQVVRALLSIGSDIPVAWWIDFPYALRRDTPTRPFAEGFEAMPAVEHALNDADAAARLKACAAYRSQLGYQFGGAAKLEARLAEMGGTERFRGAALPI